MRIESTNRVQINPVSSSSTKDPSTVASTSGNPAADTATLSEVSHLVTKAVDQPEIRREKVEAIKAQIAAGSYDLNPAKIAEAMIASESSHEL